MPKSRRSRKHYSPYRRSRCSSLTQRARVSPPYDDANRYHTVPAGPSRLSRIYENCYRPNYDEPGSPSPEKRRDISPHIPSDKPLDLPMAPKNTTSTPTSEVNPAKSPMLPKASASQVNEDQLRDLCTDLCVATVWQALATSKVEDAKQKLKIEEKALKEWEDRKAVPFAIDTAEKKVRATKEDLATLQKHLEDFQSKSRDAATAFSNALCQASASNPTRIDILLKKLLNQAESQFITRFEEKILKIDQRLSALQENFTTLDKNVSSHKISVLEQLKILSEHKGTSATRLNDLLEKLPQIEQKTNYLGNEVLHLQESSTEELARLSSEFTDFQNATITKLDKFDQLQASLSRIDSERSSQRLTSEVTRLPKRVDVLFEWVQKMFSQLDEFKEELSDKLTKQVEDFRNELQAREAPPKQDSSIHTEKIEDIEEQQKQLQEEVKANRVAISQSLDENVANITNENASLRSRVEQLNTHLVQQDSKIVKAYEDNNFLKSQVDELRHQRTGDDSRIASLQSTLEQLQKTISSTVQTPPNGGNAQDNPKESMHARQVDSQIEALNEHVAQLTDRFNNLTTEHVVDKIIYYLRAYYPIEKFQELSDQVRSLGSATEKSRGDLGMELFKLQEKVTALGTLQTELQRRVEAEATSRISVLEQTNKRLYQVESDKAEIVGLKQRALEATGAITELRHQEQIYVDHVEAANEKFDELTRRVDGTDACVKDTAAKQKDTDERMDKSLHEATAKYSKLEAHVMNKDHDFEDMHVALSSDIRRAQDTADHAQREHRKLCDDPPWRPRKTAKDRSAAATENTSHDDGQKKDVHGDASPARNKEEFSRKKRKREPQKSSPPSDRDLKHRQKKHIKSLRTEEAEDSSDQERTWRETYASPLSKTSSSAYARQRVSPSSTQASSRLSETTSIRKKGQPGLSSPSPNANLSPLEAFRTHTVSSDSYELASDFLGTDVHCSVAQELLRRSGKNTEDPNYWRLVATIFTSNEPKVKSHLSAYIQAEKEIKKKQIQEGATTKEIKE